MVAEMKILLLLVISFFMMQDAMAQEACKKDFTTDSLVVLTATACPGSRFVRWYGECADQFSPVCIVKMDKHQEVVVQFELVPIPMNLRLTQEDIRRWLTECAGWIKGFHHS